MTSTHAAGGRDSGKIHALVLGLSLFLIYAWGASRSIYVGDSGELVGVETLTEGFRIAHRGDHAADQLVVMVRAMVGVVVEVVVGVWLVHDAAPLEPGSGAAPRPEE